jgi:hypothetical protein
VTTVIKKLQELEAAAERTNAVESPIFTPVTTYNPVWTASGTAPALGNGSLTGKYQIRGKMVLCMIQFTPGTTTTYGTGNWAFSLPFPASNDAGDGWLGPCHIRKTATANYERFAQILAGGTTITNFITLTEASNVSNLTKDLPWTWAHDGAIYLQVEYEMA